MKKRFLSLVLALALCLGLAVPAFAANAGTSAEAYAWISEDFPYVSHDLKCQTRSVDDANKYGEAQDYTGSFPVVPTSEYFQVGVYNLAEDEEYTIAIQAWSDPDGDGVYDQRLFRAHTEKDTYEGKEVDVLVGVDVLPIPKDGAYETASDIVSTAPPTVIPGFEKVDEGDYAFSADRLHELFGDNTLIFFISRNSGEVLGSVLLSAGAFDDVPGLGWYSDTVAWAAEKGIAAGTGDGIFEPGSDCTHMQILTFLSRAAGNTKAADYGWAEEQKLVVEWATEKGMIGEGFEAGKPCTRAEAVNYIWQAFDKPSAAASSFKDMEGYESYAKAVDWAAEKGVTKGSGGGVFDPGKICNRAEIVTFLWRAYNN